MRLQDALVRLVPCAVVVGAYGCSVCPPTITKRVELPSHQYLAGEYTYACGPVPPFNAFVGLSVANEQKPTQVASIREAPMELRPEWVSNTELQIVFDCNSDADAACAPSAGRHWSVGKTAKWRDVRISYAATERLRARLSPADVDRLLR
jgi:hypothetical protein